MCVSVLSTWKYPSYVIRHNSVNDDYIIEV